MRVFRLFPLFAVALLSTGILCPAQTPSETQPRKQEDTGKPESGLKLVKSPRGVYPQEELKKIGGKGKVTVRIVVDAKGRVSEAQPLTGPPELFPAAIENVKHWEFEPPALAPVVTTVEIGYYFPKECPGVIAESGDIQVSGRLLNKNGEVAGVAEEGDYPMPPYPDKEIRAGHSGDMVLAVRLDAQGRVKRIRVVKSISPGLDRAAMKTFRKWKFKLNDENPDALREEYQLRIPYRTMCSDLP